MPIPKRKSQSCCGNFRFCRNSKLSLDCEEKIIIRQPCAEQRAFMFGNSVLRSYTKNLPIRQFRVTQLRKELAYSAILCYAKNLPMISTISAPMRFWASVVEAPIWGVQLTWG